MAVELPVDPAAVVAVPAQEAVDLPPAVVIVPPVAAAVAVRTESARELSELISAVGRGPNHRRLLQARLRLRLLLVASPATAITATPVTA